MRHEEDAGKRNFDDNPVKNSIRILMALAYIFAVAYFSARLDFPAKQLAFAAGLGAPILVLRLLRAHR